MTNKNRPDPNSKKDSVQDIRQESTIEDTDHLDRPGTRPGQPSTNDDYDYRPDYGTSGGGAEYGEDKMIDGEPDTQKRAKLPKQEGDKPKDIDQPEEKMNDQSPKK